MGNNNNDNHSVCVFISLDLVSVVLDYFKESCKLNANNIVDIHHFKNIPDNTAACAEFT